MTDRVRQAEYLSQMMSIMNQLHRLALNTPPDTYAPGMTMPQLCVIGCLTFLEGHDVFQRDLETIFKLRRSTLSSVISTLEKRGYLSRVPVPQDARLKKLVLTETGQAIGLHVYAVFSHLNDLMVAGLTPEELTAFATIMGKIAHNLNEAEHCPPPGIESLTSTSKEAPAT